MRKIAVITGTRAEYGLLYWILQEIQTDSVLELQLIVTGMHLSPEFGYTVQDIIRDGLPIAERVEMLLSADTDSAITTSMGLGMIGFAKAYERLRPDIIVVLGDRFEILAAVAAAVPFKIPVAHIHGGESTEGVMDEQFRHAITKMSLLHFPATQTYAKRIVQMGEAPERVFCYGAPGVDNILKLDLWDWDTLHQNLDLPADKKIGVLTYHPVTLDNASPALQMQFVLDAIARVPDMFWVCTLPNADTGGRAIAAAIANFVAASPNIGKAFASLGQLRYLSLLKHAAVMVGNSSSGLLEAPSFTLPVVNIGDRQRGRIRARNVLDVPQCETQPILEALHKALSAEFRNELSGLENPYGSGDSSQRIVDTLKRYPLNAGSLKKSFCDYGQA